MAEHLSIEIIDRYRRKTLTGEERFVADMHIVNCSKCREQLGELEKLQSAFNAIRFDLASITEQTIEHPDDEQLSDFINRKLDKVDTEIVASHLAWCSTCVVELEEMEAFGRQLKPENRLGLKEKAHWHGWASLPKWIPVTQRPSLARVAQVSAVLMLALVSYVFLNWQSSDKSEKQTVQLTQSPNSTPQSDSFVSPSPIIPPPSLPMSSPGNDVNNASSAPLPDNLILLSGVLPAEHQLLSSAFLNGAIETAEETSGWSALRKKAKQDALLGGGADSSFALLSPAGLVIRENRPTLKWEPFNDAVEYQVKIVDSTLGTTLPTHIVKGTEYKIESPLESGHVYIWQIAAKEKDGNDVYGRWPNRIRTHAEFRVLATDELKLVQDAEKNYQPDKDPIAYLALAARYAKAGLVEDAEQMLNAYLKERPASPQVVKMLNSLKRQSGGK